MQVAIITGASKGIGLELAKYLSDKNIKVYGLSRTTIKDDKIKHLSVDIKDETAVSNAIDYIYKEEGRIDYLINNAGMGISGSIESTSINDLRNIIDVNFIGAFLVIKSVLKYMREKNNGKIINIGSVASEFAIPFQAFYSSTKSALKVFSEALNNEVSPYGIRVCTILPGDTKTSFTKNRKYNDTELDVYKNRVSKSVGLMEKDEQNGMSSLYVTKKIYKVLRKKRMPVEKTIGTKYKLFIFIKRLFPSRFINFIVGKLYGFKKTK